MRANPLLTIASYTFVEAIRNRMLWLSAALIICGFTFAEFIADVAITETQQFRSALLGAFLRVAVVLMLSFFVVSSVIREFNDKGLQLVLSLPIPRTSYLVGKVLGFAFFAGVVAVGCGVTLLLYAPALQCLLWATSLWLELLVVIGFCMLCLLTFNQVTSALCAVVLFYFVSRSIASLQLMTDGPFAQSDSLGHTFIDGFVALLRFLLPNLADYTRTEWLVYHSGSWAMMPELVFGTLIYVLFLLGAALFDLHRRNF